MPLRQETKTKIIFDFYDDGHSFYILMVYFKVVKNDNDF